MSPELAETKVNGPEPTHAKMFLFGLTTEPIAALAAIDRSWTNPPQIVVNGEGYRSNGYDPTQRAYQIESLKPADGSLSISLAASKASPVFNPVFIIKGWGSAQPSIAVNGKPASRNFYRIGQVHELESTDLIVWLQKESDTPIKITIESENRVSR
jgi:hypothetical protein